MDKNPIVINVNNKKYFPKSNKINKYKITNIGIYSICKPHCANKISKIIKSYFNNPKSNILITDATGGIGGNTINFAKHFKHVFAIEYDNTHFDILRHNILISEIKNVTLINDNCENICPKLKQDVIYIDPPWGGPNYKDKKSVKLKICDKYIEDFCNDLQNNAKYIVINVPYNFDFERFLKKSKFDNIDIYNIKKTQYIIIVWNNPPHSIKSSAI